MQNTEKTEKCYFYRFKEAYKSFPEGSIEFSDKPDVIVRGHKTIGIEITNFYYSSGKEKASEQKQRVIRERILKKAQNIYLENGGQNIEFSFDFNVIKQEGGLAKKVADFALGLAPQVSGQISPSLFSSIPEISFCYANILKYDNPKWRVYKVHNSKEIDRQQLIKVIKEKEKKAKYYQRCHDYWLLIVIDFMDPAQDQEVEEKIISDIKSTFFEKVLIYRTLHNIIEL